MPGSVHSQDPQDQSMVDVEQPQEQQEEQQDPVDPISLVDKRIVVVRNTFPGTMRTMTILRLRLK